MSSSHEAEREQLLDTSEPLRKHDSKARTIASFASGFLSCLILGLLFSFAFSPARPTASRPASNKFPAYKDVPFHGVTATGIEAFLAATATAQPKLYHAYPLTPDSECSSEEKKRLRLHGNLTPFMSVPSERFGMPNASDSIPPTCELTQVHLLHRHGARYPTLHTNAPKLAERLKAAGSFKATDGLAFLSNWTYPLGAEILTPFGRLQLFQLGVSFRMKYGHLLDKMPHKPVFRTTSQDRMAYSALNFHAGFFGIPFEEQYHQIYIPEAVGFNNTLAPHFACPNDGTAVHALGFIAAANWTQIYLKDTVPRLQSMIEGVELTITDVQSMLELCSYETVALGYSAFCPLFTTKELEGYEYYHDLAFHYSYGFGSPIAAAMGIGWVQELVSRLTQIPVAHANSSTNSTITSDTSLFPLDQSIYVDASHDTDITSILVAMNFTSLGASGPLPLDHIPSNLSWNTADISPFALNLIGQRTACGKKEYIRWILNDGVLPISGMRGCGNDPNGWCELDTFVSAMKQRIAEVDFAYDCYADYPPSWDIRNGRPPGKY